MNMKMMKIAMCVLAVAVVACSAQADVMYSKVASFNGDGAAAGYEVGFEFTTANPINVTALGTLVSPVAWDNYNPLLNGDEYVSIYAVGNSTALVTAMIPGGTAPDADGFAYTPANVALPAGSYIIQTSLLHDLYAWAPPSYVAFDGNFTYVTGYWDGSGIATTQYPGNTYGAVGVGPNLQFTVPEPVTMALLAIGGIGALLRRRK